MSKIALPNVTLCAASDVAVQATLQSMRRCMEAADFHKAIFFNSTCQGNADFIDIDHIGIDSLRSREDYSRFILTDLAPFIQTDFALIVQWDGFIVDASAWRDEFLAFDYIGAPWLDYSPPDNVGNGGFSLRSRRLLDAGSQLWFQISHPEDLCICHENRAALQDHGFRIADCQTAQTFSRERFPPGDKHFGAHGIFVLAELMDEADFETFLRTIEFGVIGKRELLDTLHVLKEKGINRGYAVKRCATEYIRRYPMDLKSASLLRHLL